MRAYPLVVAVVVLTSPITAAELRLAPGDVVLSGPKASQRLVVHAFDKGQVTGDVTTSAKFVSSNPKTATVDAEGTVRAAGDGEATITATVGGDKTLVRVKVEKTAAPFEWNFKNHVLPVLTKLGCNSGACHGALAGKGGFKLSLRGYAPEDDHFVLTRQANARRVNLVEPARSLMLLKPTLAQSHGGGLKLEVRSPDYDLLADWIASGAHGIHANDARLLKLDVYPEHAVLKPKDALQMLVRGHYSDGRIEDVTRWAKFTSTEDLVAGVDEHGLVRVAGHGEAAITVWFSNHVAVARVTSPLPNLPDPKAFAAAPRVNFVDDLILKKLEALRIPPSPGCGDSEFIRRAYLDAAGILPTPEEVARFLADKGADKRGRLIDSLLQRPEFVDYWAYKWSDLLLISSRKLPQPAMRAFYQFVRQSVADNKPWDQFAREILTASGGNLQNGAANYYVLHKEITDLSETTAVTFMGMSITCARCHNHPLEKWTQDQYWGMANLFAQIAIKNGDRPGEVTVQSLFSGDVLHPRRGIPIAPAPLDGAPVGWVKPTPNPTKTTTPRAPLDRRQHFAGWLTSPDNPFFARAAVNRVWRNFMGRGLVEAEDDHRQTNPASNEELLDALARDFVKNGYDMKRLARVIMNSAAYQRSSTATPENKADDRFYSRYFVRRLPAEVVLDAYSQVTKVPTEFGKVAVGTSGGEAKTTDYPLGTRALQLPDTQLVSLFLDAFGRPERGQPCSCERQGESSVTQALHLNNGKTLNDKLREKTSRVEEWLKEKVSDEDAVRRVFLLALARQPTREENERLLKIMAEAQSDPKATRREAIEDLFWAVLTGREFLFNR